MSVTSVTYGTKCQLPHQVHHVCYLTKPSKICQLPHQMYYGSFLSKYKCQLPHQVHMSATSPNQVKYASYLIKCTTAVTSSSTNYVSYLPKPSKICQLPHQTQLNMSVTSVTYGTKCQLPHQTHHVSYLTKPSKICQLN